MVCIARPDWAPSGIDAYKEMSTPKRCFSVGGCGGGGIRSLSRVTLRLLQARSDLARSTPTRRLALRFASGGFAPPRFESLPLLATCNNTEALLQCWRLRRGRDSNPRRYDPYSISSRALSTSQPPLRMQLCSNPHGIRSRVAKCFRRTSSNTKHSRPRLASARGGWLRPWEPNASKAVCSLSVVNTPLRFVLTTESLPSPRRYDPYSISSRALSTSQPPLRMFCTNRIVRFAARLTQSTAPPQVSSDERGHVFA